jgi:hypothetical protein
MNLTLTNNFYSLASTLLFGNSTALGTTATDTTLGNPYILTMPITLTDNSQITQCGGYKTTEFSMGSVSDAKNPNSVKLYFDIGSDNTPATKNDHTLTALTDDSYTIRTEINRYVLDGIPKVKYIVTITAGTADITFTEIGMLKKLPTTGAVTSYTTLLGRAVIPETTITAGNAKIFDIDIDIPT